MKHERWRTKARTMATCQTGRKARPQKGHQRADAIKTNRALTKLNMSGNNFYATEAGKALGDMLAVNTVLKELDLSKCNMKNPASVKAFSAGLGAIRALSFLNIKDNKIDDEGKTAIGSALRQSNVQFLICDEWSITQETDELNLSSKELKTADAVLLGGILCNNSVLTSLNVSGNKLNAEGATHIVAAIRKCQ